VDAWSYLPGTTGDAWERMCGTTGDAWARLAGTAGDAWERLSLKVVEIHLFIRDMGLTLGKREHAIKLKSRLATTSLFFTLMVRTMDILLSERSLEIELEEQR